MFNQNLVYPSQHQGALFEYGPVEKNTGRGFKSLFAGQAGGMAPEIGPGHVVPFANATSLYYKFQRREREKISGVFNFVDPADHFGQYLPCPARDQQVANRIIGGFGKVDD